MLFRQYLHLVPFALAATVKAVAAANDTYEYIVVGSGPGGGPLAANLARAGHTVLLLEAGDDEGDSTNVTIVANNALASDDPKTRWDFYVKHSSDQAREEQYKYTNWRLPDGSFYVGLDPPAGAERLGIWYPRAGTLGGCATHNVAAAFLPNDADWEYIATLTGDDGWLPNNMRPHFERLENNLYLPKGTPGHGFDGYININQDDASWAEQPSDGTLLGQAAAIATGYNASDLETLLRRDINAQDPNRDQTTGIFGFANHKNDQDIRSSPIQIIRQTVADGYPLTVSLESLATKVLFSNTTGNILPTAVGVEYLKGQSMYSADPRYDASNTGTKSVAYASREIIIAGGVFNSPQLLKLSGIGPADELTKFNIPVVVDSPGVGKNLGDNYEGSILQFAAQPLNGSAGRMPILLKTSSAKVRDTFMWCLQFAFEGFWHGWPWDYGAKEYECAIAHMYPTSQAGSVLLRSADPRDVPDINFEFFADGDADLDSMAEALDWARTNIFDKGPDHLKPWQEQWPCPYNSTDPNASTCTSGKSQAEKDYLKVQAYSHHAQGTCAIGADGDVNAVLDSKLRVRGVKGLRVSDASVFPKVVSAFPVLPTFVLSEKALSDILADANSTLPTTK